MTFHNLAQFNFIFVIFFYVCDDPKNVKRARATLKPIAPIYFQTSFLGGFLIFLEITQQLSIGHKNTESKMKTKLFST